MAEDLKNIDRLHIIKAIERINKEGIPPEYNSRDFDLQFNQNKYPPKLVISYANKVANGEEFDRDFFIGKLGRHNQRLLERLGFRLVPKKNVSNEFYPTLIKFLSQVNANPPNHHTKEYPKSFQDLDIQIFFNSNSKTAVNYILLTDENDKANDGIFPAILYYKSFDLLLAVYGVSDIPPTDRSWPVDIATQTTVEEYLQNNWNIKSWKFHHSIIHSIYFPNPSSADFDLDPETFNQDLNSLIEIYKDSDIINSPVQIPETVRHISFNPRNFINANKKSNLIFSDDYIYRFIYALLTKPFVILTGLSGSGKTKLAQNFAKWISASDNQICIVPVGADWTNREPLLGYPNALEPGNYVLPESGALSLILEAIANPDLPFFLILDEMNLSHVEKYFADFLSTMESGEKIHLHPASIEWSSCKVPPKITLPQNLFIVGTVNVDETTYMFSPKVLDRASVIEFRVAAADMLSFLNLRHSSSSTDVSGDGANMARDFLSIANKNLTVNADEKKIHDVLIALFATLQQAGVEFGYRSAKEMLRFAAIVQKHVDAWEYEHIIDYIILQKLLPRIHGSRRQIEPVLLSLQRLCTDGDDSAIRFKHSHEKISRMRKGLLSNGYTSFAEA